MFRRQIEKYIKHGRTEIAVRNLFFVLVSLKLRLTLPQNPVDREPSETVGWYVHRVRVPLLTLTEAEQARVCLALVIRSAAATKLAAVSLSAGIMISARLAHSVTSALYHFVSTRKNAVRIKHCSYEQ